MGRGLQRRLRSKTRNKAFLKTVVDSRLRTPLLLCESDDIWSLTVAQTSESSTVCEDGRWWTYDPWTKFPTQHPACGNHRTVAVTQKQSSKQRRSWSSSEQWFDTCLDNQMTVVFCVSLTWLCDTQLSAVVCFVCRILDLLTVFCGISWVTVWTFFHTVVKEFISPLESHRKGTSMKCSPHTVQYSAAHTVATLNSAFLSFGKALVHRRKKTDKFMLTRLLKVLCSMEKRLHFLHTHNFLRKKIVQVFFFFNEFLSPTAFLPPFMFPLASRRQAKRATGTSWPDQVTDTAVSPVLGNSDIWVVAPSTGAKRGQLTKTATKYSMAATVIRKLWLVWQ